MKNSDKIILDLCGGTGAWSKPYAEAGYEQLLHQVLQMRFSRLIFDG